MKGLSLRLWANADFVRSGFGARFKFLLGERTSGTEGFASRLGAGKLHQPQCWFQLGDPPTETKFSPSKAIFPQERCLTIYALPFNRGSLPARSVLRHSSDSENMSRGSTFHEPPLTCRMHYASVIAVTGSGAPIRWRFQDGRLKVGPRYQPQKSLRLINNLGISQEGRRRLQSSSRSQPRMVDYPTPQIFVSFAISPAIAFGTSRDKLDNAVLARRAIAEGRRALSSADVQTKAYSIPPATQNRSIARLLSVMSDDDRTSLPERLPGNLAAFLIQLLTPMSAP